MELEHMGAGDILKSAELLKDAFLKVASTMAMADGRLDETEIEAIAGFCSRFTGDIIGQDQIAEMAMLTNHSINSLNAYLEKVRDDLPLETKEVLVHAAYNVAIADGVLSNIEKSILVDISMALGLSNDHSDALLEKLCDVEDSEQTGDELVKHALIKTLTSMVMADNLLKVSEIDSLAGIFRRFSGIHMGVDEIEEIAESIAEDSLFHLPHYLLSIEERLNTEAKENLVRAAICAAKADDEFADEEMNLLKIIAKSLRIPEDRLQELLAEKII